MIGTTNQIFASLCIESLISNNINYYRNNINSNIQQDAIRIRYGDTLCSKQLLVFGEKGPSVSSNIVQEEAYSPSDLLHALVNEKGLISSELYSYVGKMGENYVMHFKHNTENP